MSLEHAISHFTARPAPSRAARCVALATALALSLALGALALPARATAAPADAGALASQLQTKQAEAAQVQARVAAMRSELATQMAAFDHVNAQLDATTRGIGDAKRRLSEIEASRAIAQRHLDDRAVHLYQADGFDTVGVLLDTGSISDFIARVDFLALIGEGDARLVDEIRSARDENLQLQSSLQDRQALLTGLRAEVAARRASIEAELSKQQAYLDSLAADIRQLVADQERAGATSAANADTSGTGGGSWMGAPSLLPGATATVDAHPGASYVIPAGQAVRYRSTGIAFDWLSSWYGNADNAPTPTATASNRPFNESELTCANKTLPFGTLLAVTYGDKHAIVAVTDHGPYIPGRSLDLSKGTAGLLGFDGVVPIHVEIVVPAP